MTQDNFAATASPQAEKCSTVAAPAADVGAFDPAAGPCAEGAALGLVSSKTSDPLIAPQDLASKKFVLIDPHQQRAARCKRSILNASRLITHRMQGKKARYQVAFVTLTYRNQEDWSPRHISAFLHRVRQYLKRKGWPLLGLWKAEMQKRGVIHYHLLIWLPRGQNLPKPDKQGWWPWGMTNITRAKNAYGYVAKYLKKEEHAMLPKGARIFSLMGMEKQEKREIRWWNTPKWLREKWPVEHDPQRCKGGGWVSRLTGEISKSSYQFHGFMWHEGRRILKFIKAEAVQREAVDYRQATRRQDEIGMWSDLANSMQLNSDRLGWLKRVEGITGSWQ